VTISDLGQHAGKDLQAKIDFVPETVRPRLDDPDLGVNPLNEPQPVSTMEALLFLHEVIIPDISRG
jgi:hypothetical protein